MATKIILKSGALVENVSSEKPIDWVTALAGEYDVEDVELVPDKGLSGFCDEIAPDVELLFYEGSYQYV